MDPTRFPFYTYTYNTFVSKSMITQLENEQDQEIAKAWLTKLSECNRSFQDVLLRNDFLYYLVLSLQNGNLRAPFNQLPIKNKSLKDYIHELPQGLENIQGINLSTDKPKVISDEGGKFLIGEKIPSVGAFCLMCVQSRIN